MTRAQLGGEHVEGLHAVRELLVAGARPVKSVTISSGRDHDARIGEILALANQRGVVVSRLDPQRLRAEARTDAPQGVIARAAPVTPADVDTLLTDPRAFLVALDGITDPGNLGAVLRTADAAGATGVVLPRRRSAHLTPAAVKAAAGAVEHVPVALVSGSGALLERAARAGVWSVGLDPEGTTSVFDLPVADRSLVLVLGAEGRGLSRLVRDRCDVVARIPMHGSLASLNVSAAAAVAAFEVARRRSHPGA